MRNYKAIATYIAVGVLSLIPMSAFAYQVDLNPSAQSHLPYATSTYSFPYVVYDFDYYYTIFFGNDSLAYYSDINDYATVGSRGYIEVVDNKVKFKTDGSNLDLIYQFSDCPNNLQSFDTCTIAMGPEAYKFVSTLDSGGFYSSIDTYKNGIKYYDGNFDLENKITRIIDMIPADLAVIGIPGLATSSVNISVSAYFAEADLNTPFTLKFSVQNIDQNVDTVTSFITKPGDLLGISLNGYDVVLYTGVVTGAGYYTFSTTTVLSSGGYRLNATIDSCISAGSQCLIQIPGVGIHISESTQFTVNQGTFMSDINQNMFRGTVGVFASTTSTTTAATYGYCNPFGYNFSVGNCLGVLFIPDQNKLYQSFSSARNTLLVAFPFGYLTRFYTIISSSTVGSLPDLKITLPAGYPGAGLVLDMTPWGHLMGQGSYLASTTSIVTGVTFYESFNYYWTFFIYFCFGLGVILRLINLNDTVSLPFGFGGNKQGGTERRDKYGYTKTDRLWQRSITNKIKDS